MDLLDDGDLNDEKHELNDNGLDQDDCSVAKKQRLTEEHNKIQLLDLSDDVLLYILQYCTPQDLKALGYTCPRLGTLVLDRTLWVRVDARSCPAGVERLSWYLKHGIKRTTKAILLSGFAREIKGCTSRCHRSQYVLDDSNPMSYGNHHDRSRSAYYRQVDAGPINHILYQDQENEGQEPPRRGIIREGPVVQIYESMPRLRPFPFKVNGSSETEGPTPKLTLSRFTLTGMQKMCPKLTTLALEYCNLDCSITSVKDFPNTLVKVSLRGSKCFNQTFDRTFLFQIQDTLKMVEELDVSECDWVEPPSFLPLSKMPVLRRLYMRNCCKLSECVAYSSLATRYGFSTLQVIDLRESPVGDSEVSSFGWVTTLEELYVSPAPTRQQPKPDDNKTETEPEQPELDLWEQQEPEYYSNKFDIYDFNEEDAAAENDENKFLKRKREIIEEYDKLCEMKDYPYRDHIKLFQLDDLDAKRSRLNVVNQGASTSREHSYINNEQFTGNELNDVSEQNEPMGMDLQNEQNKLMVPSEENEQNKQMIIPGSSKQTEAMVTDEQNDQNKSADKNESNSQNKTLATNNPAHDSPNYDSDQNKPTTSNEPGTSKYPQSKPGSLTNQQPPERPLGQQSRPTRKRPHNHHNQPSVGRHLRRNSPIPFETQLALEIQLTIERKLKQERQPSLERPQGEQNEPPLERSNEQQNEPPLERPNEQQNQAPLERPIEQQRPEASPRPVEHIIHVDVCRQVHAMYRLTMPVYRVNEPPMVALADAPIRHLDVSLGPYSIHHNPVSFVSDTAVHRFGRADTDNVNYINIGPNGIQRGMRDRLDRSNLRVLSITGFRNITDRSLVHLATAAPLLRLVDFTGTRVTERGVEVFKSLRPDCEVLYTKRD